MNSESILHQRDPEHYPEELKIILQRLTINETPKVVGSTAYSQHKYPSDVDVFEKVTIDLPKDDALRFYADHFVRVAQIIVMDSDEMVFSDFKAGEDVRFGEKAMKAHGGSPKSFLYSLKSKGLLGAQEYTGFDEIVEEAPTSKRKALVLELLRDKRILRWTLEELIAKKKQLAGGKMLTLEEALAMPNIVKIDVFSWYSGRWQSIEVFYNLSYRQKDSGYSREGRTVEFNPMGSYVQALLEEIEKYGSAPYTSPLKVIKRMWSLARVAECEDMLEALTPALGSNAAALNQVAGDMEMLWELLGKKITVEHISRIFIELINFSKRLAPHADVATYREYQRLSAGWFDRWRAWRVTGDLNKLELIEELEAAYDLLQRTIRELASAFLDKVERMNITCANPRFQNL